MAWKLLNINNEVKKDINPREDFDCYILLSSWRDINNEL